MDGKKSTTSSSLKSLNCTIKLVIQGNCAIKLWPLTSICYQEQYTICQQDFFTAVKRSQFIMKTFCLIKFYSWWTLAAISDLSFNEFMINSEVKASDQQLPCCHTKQKNHKTATPWTWYWPTFFHKLISSETWGHFYSYCPIFPYCGSNYSCGTHHIFLRLCFQKNNNNKK